MTKTREELVEMVAKDENLLREAVEVLKDSAVTLGILLRRPSPTDTLKVAPLTLFPNTVPKAALAEIVDIQCDINLLMHNVAHDGELFAAALNGAAVADSFIRNLFHIYNQTNQTNQAKWELGLFRSDYILSQKKFCQCEKECYQQVEVNTICAGLAGLGAKIGSAHKKIRGFLECKNLVENSFLEIGDSLSLFGEGLRAAYEVYCKENCLSDKKQTAREEKTTCEEKTNYEKNEFLEKTEKKNFSLFSSCVIKSLLVMLIVVHEGFEFNVVDQRMIEFSAGVRSIRRSFREIAETARLDEEGRLFVEDREVAVVYYRTGYSPDQYKDRDWEMRLLIETSKAIKCPSVAYQLAGFKKIQQILSRRDVLQRFISEEKVISRMQMTFVGQWDISEKSSEKKIEEALKEPEKYVLKPNREGGGNNFYGEDLVKKLKEVQKTIHAKEFILMELIQPVFEENFFVRNEKISEKMKTISEVGVFGVILAKNGQILLNKSAKEVLVRSKASDAQEGGVSSGHSCISSLVAI